MIGKSRFPKCKPARTRRGERPDKMRHPQSGNSTDVKESLVDTISYFNNTTIVSFFNPYRHQKISLIFSTLELLLGSFCSNCQHFFLGESPPPARGRNRAGPTGMRDHGCRVQLFNPSTERSHP